MKIFTSAQISELDTYTIENEPISSINLMERAAEALTKEIVSRWDSPTPITIFAGHGNNGGDALAVARLMADKGYKVNAYLFNVKSKISQDCEVNRDRLKAKYPDALHEITKDFDPPRLSAEDVVIDGLFGSGLNKPLTGGFAALVKYINASGATIVSIDIPSGLMPEDNTSNVRANIINADLTLTLGAKKLCMMFADNSRHIGELKVLDINLSKEYIANTEATYSVIDEKTVVDMLKPRGKFAHKGQMGHALLVAGSQGMAGAATLAARACLRSGVGKVTVHTPRCNNGIIQISVPEAILHLDKEETYICQASDSNDYDAMGIGPGIGVAENTAIALMTIIRGAKKPCIIDADALNILSTHRAWLQQIPEGMIFTPHPKEMDRLADSEPTDDGDRLQKAIELAERTQGYVLLKGHYSALCMPDGKVLFNSTGNSGMATAGAGDVLTGIITGLLARGYNQKEAACLGMYLHGLAGDMAAHDLGKESLIASDIINYIPKAFKRLNQ